MRELTKETYLFSRNVNHYKTLSKHSTLILSTAPTPLLPLFGRHCDEVPSIRQPPPRLALLCGASIVHIDELNKRILKGEGERKGVCGGGEGGLLAGLYGKGWHAVFFAAAHTHHTQTQTHTMNQLTVPLSTIFSARGP